MASSDVTGVRIVQAKKGENGTDAVVYVRLECRAPTWASALLIATRIAKTMGVKFEPETDDE